MVSLSNVLASVALAAFSGALAGDAGSLPHPPDRTSTTVGATARLSELLDSAFRRRPGSDGEDHWRKTDFDRFWTEIVSLLDRGADANAAYRGGASVWNAAFVGDPRCECAPNGWPGFVTSKCPNPGYFRGCDKLDRAKREARISVLLQHGVDPNLSVLDGSSKAIGAPLCIAAATGLWAGVDRLLARGASCTAPCDGYTVLHVAADTGDSKLLCKFLACGAPVDGRDRQGKTPLVAAAESGSLRNVTILLDYGADPGALVNGATGVSHIGQKKKRAAVVRLLKRWRTGAGGPATYSSCAR